MTRERATLMYQLGRSLANVCFGTFGRLEVTGAENVPPYGPVILVSNHLSFNDPPLLVASVSRPLYFVGKKELFANPVSRFILRGIHVSPLGHSGSGIDAMRTLVGHLDKDRIVVLFPEGHRSPDHTMKEGMLGVVYLALKSQATILPVGVTGTQNFPGWRMPLPLCKLKANIGQPFSLPGLEGKPSKEVMQSILDMIMDRVAAQLPSEYRGDYGDSARRANSGQRTPVA